MSDFSIDYILNRAGEQYIGTNASMGIMRNIHKIENHRVREHLQMLHQDCQIFQNFERLQRSFVASGGKVPSDASFGQVPMYDWLQYTRYHPPKLPRSLRPGPAKRTPGRLPRIPFSPPQLQALEEAYKTSNYLSAEDANRLAESLDLTNTRVKIWFQNRRARERRENREKSYHEHESSNASSSEPEDLVIVE